MEKSKTIEKLFYYIVTWSYLALPAFFLLFRPKKTYTAIIASYGIIAFTLLLLFESLPLNLKIIYVCLYTIIEYLFFSTLLYHTIVSSIYKRYILILSCCFVIFQLIYFFTVEIGRLDSVPVGIETILIFMYIFMVFYEQFKNPQMGSILNTYSFWLALGMLLYLGGSFFFNIMINYISSKDISKYLYITYVPEILKNLFFAIAIFFYVRNPSLTKLSKSNSVPYLDMI